MLNVSDKAGGFRRRLIDEIASGVYHNNDRMPSERELCQRYDLSRTTVRQALAELEEAALLVRRSRSGAFLAGNAAQLAGRLQRPAEVRMTVDWLMTADDAANPLLQAAFNACLGYLDADIRTRIKFTPPGQYHRDPDAADIAVICAAAEPGDLAAVERRTAGIILLNRRDERRSFLTPDNYRGGRMMAEYALASGSRRIGCIANTSGGEGSDFGQRYLGMQARFREEGVEPAVARLDPHYYTDLAASCHYALEMLLAAMPGLETVLCAWDLLAVGVYDSLSLRGLSIPDDIGVIGFDDQCYSQYLTPALTTVKYPAPAIGHKLAGFLNTACRTGLEPVRETVRPILIERESIRHIHSTVNQPE